MKNIVIIGMGYVGIPCAVLLADVEGFNVIGIQRRSKRSGWKIECLNSGKNPFKGKEPGLSELIARVVKKGTFRVTDDFLVCKDADIILIDVQTPIDESKVPQYIYLQEVSKKVGNCLSKGQLIIIESTVTPGTTQNIVKPILEESSGLKAGKDFFLAFSYERVMPGKLIEYIINMPRVVGGIEERSTELAIEMYKKIVKKEILATDCLTAELAKTVENAYRDVNIAFANEIALVCGSLGVNVYEIRKLINARHDRHMHIPGAGVGGHCLTKDSWLLKYGLEKYGAKKVSTNILQIARRINDSMPLHMVKLIEEALFEKQRNLKDSKIAILGAAYLEDSDDIRNTPALPLIEMLKSKGAYIIVHDPYVRKFEGESLTRDLDKALDGADGLAIVTKHSCYFALDLNHLKKIMRTPVIIDGRNVFDYKKCVEAGFIYKGIGKG